MFTYDMSERKLRDLQDAVSKLPCNLKALCDFLLDDTQPENDRLDFMHTLAGQHHPSIKFILETLRDRGEGHISEAAYKILLKYDSGVPCYTYNNLNEAMEELPKMLHPLVRKLQEGADTKEEAWNLIRKMLSTKHPAATYILEQLGFGHIIFTS